MVTYGHKLNIHRGHRDGIFHTFTTPRNLKLMMVSEINQFIAQASMINLKMNIKETLVQSLSISRLWHINPFPLKRRSRNSLWRTFIKTELKIRFVFQYILDVQSFSWVSVFKKFIISIWSKLKCTTDEVFVVSQRLTNIVYLFLNLARLCGDLSNFIKHLTLALLLLQLLIKGARTESRNKF